MKLWNALLVVASNEIIEHGVDKVRSEVSPDTSGGRKRNLSGGADGYDDNAKRRISDVHPPMTLPVSNTDTVFSRHQPTYGCVHTLSYPVSSLYYSPSQRDDGTGHSGSYSSQSRSSSDDLTSHISSSYKRLSDSNGGYYRSTRTSTTERFGSTSSRPSSVTRYMEHGYSEQYDFRDHQYLQEAGDTARGINERNPPMPSYVPSSTKRNRFNLSRYQLHEDEDRFATIDDQSANTEDVKPKRFKTQRERLMQARAEESDESGSTADPGYESEIFPSHEGEEDSSSRDSMVSPRERLRQFTDEHSHHVAIPNQWEGEKNLHEFVTFGTIEDALRPIGLMMARSALVNDSVTTRFHLQS